VLCVICLTVFRFCGCVQARDFCASVISKKLLVFANAQYSSIASVHYFFLPSSVFRNKDRLTAEKLSGYVVGLWGFLRLMTCIFVCLAWWLQSSKNWYKKRRWRRQHWNMVEEFGGNFETAISVIIIAKRARGCTLDSLFFSYVGANALRLKQGNLLIADGQSCWVANSYGHDWRRCAPRRALLSSGVAYVLLCM